MTARPSPPAVDASDDSFRFYAGGLYHNPDCHTDPAELDHAVIISGYGTTNEGEAPGLTVSAVTGCWAPAGGRRCWQHVLAAMPELALGAGVAVDAAPRPLLRSRRRALLAGEEYLEPLLGGWVIREAVLVTKWMTSRAMASPGASQQPAASQRPMHALPTACLSHPHTPPTPAGRGRLPAGDAQGQRLRGGLRARVCGAHAPGARAVSGGTRAAATAAAAAAGAAGRLARRVLPYGDGQLA